MKSKHLTCILSKNLLSLRAAFSIDMSKLFKKVASMFLKCLTLKVFTSDFFPDKKSGEVVNTYQSKQSKISLFHTHTHTHSPYHGKIYLNTQLSFAYKCYDILLCILFFWSSEVA